METWGCKQTRMSTSWDIIVSAAGVAKESEW